MTPDEKQHVSINLEEVTLVGNMFIPTDAKGLVIFSHGSGSSRLSPRNNFVADVLNENKIGTFLFDLLTEEEDKLRENRFDLDKLTSRLVAVTKWIKAKPEIKDLSVGYFGASTGSASALKAAARFGNEIKAVVSRGGRPDLAMEELPKVTAPTMLIIGGLDEQVIELNKQAYERLTGKRRMEIVEGASHLFEEPGKLREVASLSSEWFNEWLKS